MPVCDRDQTRSGDLATNLGLGDDGGLKEREDLRAVGVRDEQILLTVDVARGEVSLAILLLTLKRVEEPVVHDETRCNEQEVAREARILRVRELVQVLPDQQRVQHPRLTGARRHLRRVLRMVVAVSRNLSKHAPLKHRFRSDCLIEITETGCSEDFVRVDDVEDRGALSSVEIQLTQFAVVLQEPETQQLGRHRSDLVEHLRTSAIDDPRDQRVNDGRKPLGKRKVSKTAHGCTSTPEITTSDSKPNTSTARTQTVRGPSAWGRSSTAVVTIRSSSPSFSVLPR